MSETPAPLIALTEAMLTVLRDDPRASVASAVEEIDAQRAARARARGTCATCASNGACLIQRHAADVCRDDVPDDQKFGCTLWEKLNGANR